MTIETFNVKIKDLIKNYKDSAEDGVFAYDNLLTVRPPYQREFVYNDKQRDAVIDTVIKGFPLNSMYWVKNNNAFELLDGQQRTLSICQFCAGEFSIKYNNNTYYFTTFSPEVQQKILNYELFIYICDGTDDEKLEWFRTINIAGAKLTDQELLNINYIGPWLFDAKRHFSKTNCPAYLKAKDYVKGSPIRQEFLETALTWISENNEPSTYMAKHKDDKDATELWEYFVKVIDWVKEVFPTYYREMKGLDWGALYKTYHETIYNGSVNDVKVKKYMADDDVTNKKGIFEYVLSGETLEKCLNIRTFTDSQKRTIYTKQGGKCAKCDKPFAFEEMEGDHITPWSKGGKTEIGNLQMLCKECNCTKSDN